MVIECNGGLWEVNEDQYREIVRRLAHGEVVVLPDLATKMGEVALSIGRITQAEAKKLYESSEKFKELLREIK